VKRFIPLVMLAAFLLPQTLPAQPIWIGAGEMDGLILEWQKPFLDNSDGAGFFLSTLFLGYRQRTSESLLIHIEMPMSNFDGDDGGEFLLGNPYIGLGFGSEDAIFTGDVGVRVPIADEDKWVARRWANYGDIDRMDAFEPNAVPVSGLLRFRTMFPATKLGLRAHFGPSAVVFTEDRGDDIMDVYLKYGLVGMYEDEGVLVQLGFSGLYDVSEDEGDFDSNSLHQIGMTVNADVGAGIWPGLLLRFPLDERYKNAIDLVLGINFLIMI